MPRVMRVVECWWNQTARPDVISRAAIAPVNGQGLGSTMWYACAWWAIIYLFGRGGSGQRLGIFLQVEGEKEHEYVGLDGRYC